METLTVYYPPPSRFDQANGLIPFSGAPGAMFKHRTFDTVKDLTLDIRFHGSRSFHLPPRNKALILGSACCKALLGDDNINKHRGYRKTIQQTPAIITYSHMDCWDFKDEDDDGPAGNDKDVGVTKRANYLYWALHDFKKLFTPPRPHSPRKTDLSPSIATITHLLAKAPHGQVISIDIETRPQDNTLDCIGLGFLVNATWYVYTLPIYGPDNARCHDLQALGRFWRALFHTLQRSDILWVGHNLQFDLSILFHYYKLPIPRRIHDTMLACHRDNPFADKSLSHAISRYTDAADNHKGNFVANTSQGNFLQLLKYNSDDVYWTGEVYLRQICQERLSAQTSQANDSNYICMLMSFTGINVASDKLEEERKALTLKVTQLERVIRILTNQPKFNPNSTAQVADYFYGILTYEPPAYTTSGAPAVDEKSLLKLQLKQPNPLIPLILAYKAADKELSMLNFTPYETT